MTLEHLTDPQEYYKSRGKWALQDLQARNPVHPVTAKLIERVGNQTPLGVGVEKVVYDHPSHDDRAVSFLYGSPIESDESYRYTPDEIKARFYLAKLLGVLYPGNVPDVHYAASQPPHMVVEKVAGSKVDLDKPEDFQATDIIYKQLRELGLVIDDYDSNFVKRDNGAYTYLDNVDFENLKPDKIEAAIKKLDENDRPRALGWLKLLNSKIAALKGRESDIAKTP